MKLKSKKLIWLLLLVLIFFIGGFYFYLRIYKHSFTKTESRPAAIINNLALSPENNEKIALTADKFMKQYDLPGLTIGIWEGNKNYILTEGSSDIKTNQPVNPNMVFRVASITKTFTASLILILVKEGKLSLDDKLSKFYPNFPEAEKITIREMLGMSSGIHNMFESPSVIDDYYNNPLKVWSHDDLINIISKFELDFEPGIKTKYSDSNYYILGAIAEKVTNQQVEDLIQSKIIKPLKLGSTSLPTTPLIPYPHLNGYRNYPDGSTSLSDITLIDPSILWTDAGMLSNIYDLNKWVREIYQGNLIGPDLEKERLIWKEYNSYTSYGLGVVKYGNFIGHNGCILGFNTEMMYLPEKDTTIITMVNKMNNKENDPQPALELFKKIAKILYPQQSGFQ